MVSKEYFALVILSLAVASASAQCAHVTAKPDFRIQPYLGRWYYFMHSPAAFLQDECSSSDYSLQGGVINIKKLFRKGGVDLVKSGTAAPQPGNPGQMELSFPPGGGTLQVIETDYRDYSLIWTCIHPFPGTPSKNVAWIFSRHPSGPAPTTLQRLKRLLRTRFGVDALVPVNHENC